MEKKLLPRIFLLLMVSTVVCAEGGGGIELITNVGFEHIPFVSGSPSGEEWLDVQTGSITGVGGFGYGVTRNGFKIGGFGYGFWSGEISKRLPSFNTDLVATNAVIPVTGAGRVYLKCLS